MLRTGQEIANQPFMNIDLSNMIAAHYKLGTSLSTPTPVNGGLVHRMWRLETAHGVYAVKQLDHDEMAISGTQELLEKAEHLSLSLGEVGIQAMNALSIADKCVTEIEGQHFIVYPWSQGRLNLEHEITSAQCGLIGDILGRIHKHQSKILDRDKLSVEYVENDDLQKVMDQYVDAKLQDFEKLEIWGPRLHGFNIGPDQGLIAIGADKIFTHGDIHLRNILWEDTGKPILIDWESANPYYTSSEVLYVALNMAGIEKAVCDMEKFNAVLTAYKKQRPILHTEIEGAWTEIYKAEVDWILLNMERAFREDKADRKMAMDQVSDMFEIFEAFETIKPLCVASMQKHAART
jgi:Ser/Thr protein kinase RdoA (MazF antagonist)